MGEERKKTDGKIEIFLVFLFNLLSEVKNERKERKMNESKDIASDHTFICYTYASVKCQFSIL